MKVMILSSLDYKESNKHNYGDCILIDIGNQLVVYDCGSEEHALNVMDYMNSNGYDKAIFVLSHNDSDHFNGLKKLLNEGKISIIYTTLLLKYVDDILERIDDGRVTRDSVKRKLLKLYDNIAQLSGESISDIYESDPNIADGVQLIGPDKNYMLDAVAKLLDGREGDTIDDETIINATSIQVSVIINNHKMLLCGDSSFEAIEDIILDYDIMQLPHHGKANQAELIFDKKNRQIETLYIVSDNTGLTNGGSDKLKTKGHKVINTKDLIYSDSRFIRKSDPFSYIIIDEKNTRDLKTKVSGILGEIR